MVVHSLVRLRGLTALVSTTLILGLTGCDRDSDKPVPPADSCISTGCDAPLQCDTASGVCIAPPDEGCGTCPTGEQCNTATGMCEPLAPSQTCTSDADCDDGLACNGMETCVDAMCSPGARVDCGSHGSCDDANGRCVCDAGYEDLGAGCEPEALGCRMDADCESDDLCVLAMVCERATGECRVDNVVTCERFNEVCDAQTGECGCPEGYGLIDGRCEKLHCTTDSDCDDGLQCNGQEVCDLVANRCVAGTAITCPGNFQDCIEETGECACKPGHRLLPTGHCKKGAECTSDDDCDRSNVCLDREFCNTAKGYCEIAPPVCGRNALCDPLADEGERCVCPQGTTGDPTDRCNPIPSCTVDADCDDGRFCTGPPQCASNNRCMNTSNLLIGAVICQENAICDESARACVCLPGFSMVDGACVANACDTDLDCNDGRLCNGEETCDLQTHQCVAGTPVTCDGASTCNETSGECVCPPGFEGADCTTAIVCATDADCDDGRACTGTKTCDVATQRCVVSEPVDCGDTGVCIDEDGLASCLCEAGNVMIGEVCAAVCPTPQAPVLTLMQKDQILNFTVPAGYAVEIAELGATEPEHRAIWHSASSYDLAQANHNPIRLMARARSTSGSECADGQRFDWTYTLVDAYPSIPYRQFTPNPTSTAVSGYLHPPNGVNGERFPVNPIFKGWASGYTRIAYGTQNDAKWRVPENVYGAPKGTFAVIVLGNHGWIDVTFDAPIADKPGTDFVVFENGFITGAPAAELVFSELAFIEVSSDGETFVRFDTHCMQEQSSDPYVPMTPSLMQGVAGTYPAYWGNPYDLNELRNRPEVLSGKVDLERITHVRVIDIVGDGSAIDSFGNVCYDAHLTWGSAGFDLDAIGVIHQAD